MITVSSSYNPVRLHMDLTSCLWKWTGGQIYLNDAANGSSQSELSTNNKETQVKPLHKTTIEKRNDGI